MFFKRQCPICGFQPEKFSPLDSGYIQKTVDSGFSHPITEWELLDIQEYCCQKCGATDRERFISVFIKKHSSLIQGKSVIEFAPSEAVSRVIKQISPSLYRSVDKYMESVDMKLDLIDLNGIEDGSIDFFVCSHVLEHIRNDTQALNELKRILSRKGKGILLVPISKILPNIFEDVAKDSEEERWRYFGQGDHVRIYNRKGFIERIRNAGLNVQMYRAQSVLSLVNRKKFGIPFSGVLYIVSH